MQVAVRGLDRHLLIDEAAQRRGDGGFALAPHGGVTDERGVGAKLLLRLFEETRKVDRAAFLFALDHQRHADRQAPGRGLPGPAGLHEGHDLALVVARPAAEDDFSAALGLGDLRLEGRNVPFVERVDRLDVVVPVEQHMGAARLRMLGEHDGVSGRFAQARVEAERGEIALQPVGRFPAAVAIGRIGRDRGNLQEREQALEALLEPVVCGGERAIEVGHDGPPEMLRRGRYGRNRRPCRAGARHARGRRRRRSSRPY